MLRPLLTAFAALTLATGVLYPLAATGLARALFPRQAAGSPIRVDGRVRGSRLIAQATEDPRWFWSRPSPTSGFPANAQASGGSTLSGPALAEAVAARLRVLQASDPGAGPVPQDLVTASGSGLDPHISLEAARWQAPRVARARGLDPGAVTRLAEARAFRPLLGRPVVNVLDLNLALDAMGAPTRLP
ncbi:potassium-transporting ATPase subunit KdpC [Mesoterricola sediminis]|uniref:Potassium-transporting ATPase KdpC subunit n=1 Tax=Mesoterricola sediminis TaxID=2927980 RepID=A0AA48H139_9BACT|nr:potassium-transporting ATPase subunit KdpC [Mesoterricola sediminis]BDU75556.1 potassium-transporting ATPase KdpC subunit [Mesoterricola sediminis]